MHGRVLATLICLAITAGSTVGVAQESPPINQVSGIEVAEDDTGTRISILGSASPTFSVYRLDNPPRLFVDFSNSELAGEVTNWAVNNGLVDEILVLQYRDEQSLVTRVVIALESDETDYDIETLDNDVVLAVTSPGWSPGQLVASSSPAGGTATESTLERLLTEVSEGRAQLDERSERLTELEVEVDEISSREREYRQQAQSLTNDLADAEAAVAAAQSSERDARVAMVGLGQQALDLEQEIDELTRLTGSRETLQEDVEEATRRRQELQEQLRRTEQEQASVNEQIDAAALRREESERAAAEAERLQAQALASLAYATQSREEAEVALSQASRELAETETRLADTRDEYAQVEVELEQALQERAAVQGELASATREREQINSELAEARLARELLDTELADAANQRARLDAELVSATREWEQLNADLDRLLADRERQSQAVASAQTEREELERLIAQLDAERSSATDALATVEQERVATEQRLGALETERAQLSTEIATARHARTVEEGMLAELEAEHDQLNAAIERARIEQSMEASELAEFEAQRDYLSAELESSRRAREIEAAQLAELERQRDQLSGELGDVEQARIAEEQALALLEADRERLSRELAEAEQNRQQSRAALVALQTERETAEDELRDISSEHGRLADEVTAMQSQLAELRAQSEQLASQQTVLASNTTVRSSDDLAPAPSISDDTPSEDTPVPVEIVDIRFEQHGGVDRIEVEFADTAPDIESLPWQDGRAGLVIDRANLSPELERTLDTRAFGGPVQFVSMFSDDGGDVRLVAQLSEAASEILSKEGRVAAWEFTSVAEEQVAEYTDELSDFEGYNSQEAPTAAPPIRRPAGVSYTIGRRDDRLRAPNLSRRFRVTIDVVNADIQNVLRLFSDQGDVNIIASGNVSGSITLRLRDVPLDQAFALILQSQGLGWEQRGNILRVAPLEEFEEERQRELQRISEAFDVEPLQVRLRPISYADGGSMIGLLGDVLSSRGTASFDERTHTLILTDIGENLDAAEQLIDALDTQTPQVLIEARIVQTSESFSQGFGIQWGGDALFTAANGNPTGLLFPSTIGIAGGAGQTPAEGTATTPNYAVNVPGPSTGAIGFQFGSLGQAVNLNLRLSAAESTGEAKVMSAPRVLTLDGQAASISAGVSIPVQTVGAAGTNVTFIQANLSLTVTPTVTPDGFVNLDLSVTKNEPDFSRRGANGDPSIITRTADTNLLVRDGETSVIGGIFEHNQGSEETGVPFFSDIPILGALFHDYSFQDERSEMMIFVTPRIVNRDIALSSYTPGGVLMTPPE